MKVPYHIRTVVYTTSQTLWMKQHENRIRKVWESARGVTTAAFTYRLVQLDNIPLKTDNDGDVKPDWSWFRERFTAEAKALGLNNVWLHISREDRERLGIKGVSGSYNRDAIPDRLWECLIIADEGQIARGYKDLPEYVRLGLHEPGHPAAYTTFGRNTNVVHELDSGEGATGKRQIERLWPLFDLTEDLDPREVKLSLLWRLYYLMLERMNRPVYPLPEEYFTESRISQAFGVRNPRYKSGIHNGVDFPCPVGTPVIAPEDGTIIRSRPDHATMGGHVFYTCIIDHKRVWFRFLHLSVAMPEGQYRKGDIIGKTGNTGDSDGPHSHMDGWKQPIDTALIQTAAGVRAHMFDPLAFFREKVDGIVNQ